MFKNDPLFDKIRELDNLQKIVMDSIERVQNAKTQQDREDSQYELDLMAKELQDTKKEIANLQGIVYN